MAENETLDLWNDKSARRKALLARVAAGDPVESIAEDFVDDLYAGTRKLVKQGHLANLLAAGSEVDLHEAVRHSGTHPFAWLFACLRGQAHDPAAALHEALEWTVECILDRIGLDVVDSQQWPDFDTFHEFRSELLARLDEPIRDLACKMADQPDTPPRKPGTSAARKEEKHRELYGLSLIGGATEHRDADDRA